MSFDMNVSSFTGKMWVVKNLGSPMAFYVRTYINNLTPDICARDNGRQANEVSLPHNVGNCTIPCRCMYVGNSEHQSHEVILGYGVK